MDIDDEPFLYYYYGQQWSDVPQNVTHVMVDSAVKRLGIQGFFKSGPFLSRRHLMSVELNEGLERIDHRAFYECTSLRSINIPSTVKEIGICAFKDCTQLINVDLCEGLESIEYRAFRWCTSLTSIRIPSTVKEIGEKAFSGCSQLINVELCEGLELIGDSAFQLCTSLTFIRIPSTVNYIAADAFSGCESLLAIEFSEEMEQFVDEALLQWWNHGVSEASLRTYSFLARRNIPARLGAIQVQKWKENIYNMLQRIPEMWMDIEDEYDVDEEEDDEEEEEENGYTYFLDSIESQLSNYEYLQEVAPFLELALWRAKIMEHQSNGNITNVENEGKLRCRTNSFSMFAIIFPNVISFLLMNRKMPLL